MEEKDNVATTDNDKRKARLNIRLNKIVRHYRKMNIYKSIGFKGVNRNSGKENSAKTEIKNLD